MVRSLSAIEREMRLFGTERGGRVCFEQAQRFLSLVLLPHVRQDIRQNKRLHFALYQALRKAAFKPDAFYKVQLLFLAAVQAHTSGDLRTTMPFARLSGDSTL